MSSVSWWMMWVSIAVAIVTFVTGFLVLRTVNRGFFKAMFYGSIAAAALFGFLWFFMQPAPVVN